MELSNLAAKIVGFLQVGYPEGVPPKDRIALLALLRRRLSEDEVVDLARELAAAGVLPVDATDIRVAITKLTDEVPSPIDTERVKAHLVASGWPVTDDFDAS